MSKHILNTRPSRQSHSLTTLLEAAGATVFHLPVIEIESISFHSPSAKFDVMIFLSANAVTQFFNQTDKNYYQQSMMIAIGPATADALKECGYSNVTYPSCFSSAGLLAMSILNNVQDQSIAIICGENPKSLLRQTLSIRGANIQMIYCYRRKPIAYDMQTVFPELIGDKIDIVISTSDESLLALIQLFDQGDRRAWLCSKVLCVISGSMKQTALDAGFHDVVVAENATDEAIGGALSVQVDAL